MTSTAAEPLSDLITTFKERSGLSYARIAQAAGLQVGTIQSWARGLSKNPDIGKISSALGEPST